MARHVVKIHKRAGVFQINIPRKLVLKHRWGDASYVLVEHCQPDQIVIRRLIDGKALETENS